MKKKHLPKKYLNNGLHIWCSACKKTVTKAPCSHTDKQRFQSRIYNPVTKRQDCIKSHDTNDVHEAWKMHHEYKGLLKSTQYNVVFKKTKNEDYRIVFLKEAAQIYLDYLEDVNVPVYERKNLTKQHINDQTRYLLRFLKVVQGIEGTVAKFPVVNIDSRHVEAFDKHVNSLKLSARSYNAHIGAAKYFFAFLIKEKGFEIDNPFAKVRTKYIAYDPEIIPVDEFEKLLSVITPENGIGYRGTTATGTRQTVNYYRPWLKKVFIFSLLIGERRDGVVLIKWKDLKGGFIGIPNHKVNKLRKTTRYETYTPITKDLAELLTHFNISADSEDYIVAPEYSNRSTLKQFLTHAFSHYWDKTEIPRKVTFKNLRKTYITRMVDLLGDKGLHIKHEGDKTGIKHYLGKKELLSKTRNIALYDIENWM